MPFPTRFLALQSLLPNRICLIFISTISFLYLVQNIFYALLVFCASVVIWFNFLANRTRPRFIANHPIPSLLTCPPSTKPSSSSAPRPRPRLKWPAWVGRCSQSPCPTEEGQDSESKTIFRFADGIQVEGFLIFFVCLMDAEINVSSYHSSLVI